jgi:excinuclease ABC subunit B
MMMSLRRGQTIKRTELLKQLVYLQYERTEFEFSRGKFRVNGEVIDIFPANEDSRALRITFFGDLIEEIKMIDSITQATIRDLDVCDLFPASHYVVPPDVIKRARETIRKELFERLQELKGLGKTLEAERLEQRVLYDLELLKEVGFCSGIENYSRHLTGRSSGEPPATLMDYFPDDYLLVLDESHVTVSQIGGMYKGDRARKTTLVEHGFRLPSALDNRPLNDEEFWQRARQTLFVSATPGEFEIKRSEGRVVEQLIRPTGLLDPEVIIRPATNQVDDLLKEVRATVERGDRVLIRLRNDDLVAGILKRKTNRTIDIDLPKRGAAERNYAVADVVSVNRILWASQ